jgi:glycine/D-amino acid oxidase-like deaminating enzyme
MYLQEEFDGKIQETLAKFIADPEPYVINLSPPLDLRKLAGELNLLPTTLDMGGCYAIRSDGEIFSFLWDSPYDLRPEDDPRIINIVLHQASQRYPELAGLKPQKPTGAQICSFCNGTGDPLFGKDLKLEHNNIVCYCGDLGWLPPDYKTS